MITGRGANDTGTPFRRTQEPQAIPGAAGFICPRSLKSFELDLHDLVGYGRAVTPDLKRCADYLRVHFVTRLEYILVFDQEIPLSKETQVIIMAFPYDDKFRNAWPVSAHLITTTFPVLFLNMMQKDRKNERPGLWIALLSKARLFKILIGGIAFNAAILYRLGVNRQITGDRGIRHPH
jgi:hypothetical protein